MNTLPTVPGEHFAERLLTLAQEIGEPIVVSNNDDDLPGELEEKVAVALRTLCPVNCHVVCKRTPRVVRLLFPEGGIRQAIMIEQCHCVDVFNRPCPKQT